MRALILAGVSFLSIIIGWFSITENSSTYVVPDDVAVSTPALLIGTGRIPAASLDLSGETVLLEDGTPQNQFGGISAIENVPGTDRYLVLSDRGPKDGAVDYFCRFHELEIAMHPGSAQPVEVSIKKTRLLRDRNGRPFPGKASAVEPTGDRAIRLDPEGLRLDPSGNIFLSDEYGPVILAFSGSGELLDRIPAPSEFQIASPSADPVVEDTTNSFGRRSNRGMEGLAISPSGQDLTGLMQSPLLQDMRPNITGKLAGINARMLSIDRSTGLQKQFVYQLDSPDHKLHEILYLDSGRYLVIEQDGKGGDLAMFKKIMLVETDAATPLDEGIALPPDSLPRSIRPVRKTVALDLLDPAFGIAGPEMPEKIEGLSFGPMLPDGRRVLVVATDNDFRPDQDSMFFLFAVPF